MKRNILYPGFLLLLILTSLSVYGQQNYITTGNLIRVKFDQAAIDPADTLGYWYNEESDIDSARRYSEHIKSGYTEYFITHHRTYSEDQWGWPVGGWGYSLENEANPDEKHGLYGGGAFIEWSPFSLPEGFQLLKTENGVWLLTGASGSNFVSNEGAYSVVKFAQNLDSAYELQHIVGKVGDDYAAVFYNNDSSKFFCYLVDIESSPRVDTIYGGEFFLSDSATPEQITRLKDEFYLIRTFDSEWNSDKNKIYKLNGLQFQFIKTVDGLPYCCFLDIKDSKLIYIASNEINTYGFNESDTSIILEQTIPCPMTLDMSYKYGAQLSGDSLFIYKADTQEKLYSIYKNGISGLGDLFVDSPYVYIHHSVRTIDVAEDINGNANLTYKLSAYPNPFNPQTTIAFTLANAGKVELAVYDLLGRKVTELLNEYRDKGSYEVKFNGADLASGIYFYTIKAGNFVKTQKMMLLK